jgi:tellurium resistance protein TerZ
MAISLSKGQKVSLRKNNNELKSVSVGLGWGQRQVKYTVKEGGFLGFGAKDVEKTDLVEVDLDASCILFDKLDNLVDVVWFQQLRSKDGSIVHTGDDRGGGGDEDAANEVITLDLTNVPLEIKNIVFVVNSYSGETFSGIPSAFCNIVNNGDNKEFARYNLSVSGGSDRGFVAARVYRDNGEWNFEAIGEAVSGKQQSVRDIIPQAKKHL